MQTEWKPRKLYDTRLHIQSASLKWDGLTLFRDGICTSAAPVWNIYMGQTMAEVQTNAKHAGYSTEIVK